MVFSVIHHFAFTSLVNCQNVKVSYDFTCTKGYQMKTTE